MRTLPTPRPTLHTEPGLPLAVTPAPRSGMKPGVPWPGNQVLSPQVPLQLHEKPWAGRNARADGLRTRVRAKPLAARRPEAGQWIVLGRNSVGQGARTRNRPLRGAACGQETDTEDPPRPGGQALSTCGCHSGFTRHTAER